MVNVSRFIEPIAFSANDVGEIKRQIRRAKGFRPSDKALAAGMRWQREQPYAVSDDFNDVMSELSEAAKVLKHKMQRLNPSDIGILNQYWLMVTGRQIEFESTLSVVENLEKSSGLHDPPAPRKGNPQKDKPWELRLSASIASAWAFHFGRIPGKTEDGPFHKVLDVLLPAAGFEPVSIDIVKKAIDRTAVGKGI